MLMFHHIQLPGPRNVIISHEIIVHYNLTVHFSQLITVFLLEISPARSFINKKSS